MAPEQIEKPSAVDHRADIYSLGVVFYEMLTGELPLGKFQPPSKKVEVDVRLDDVVLHALEKEPERRYQQVSEVKTAVDTIAMREKSPGSHGRDPHTAAAGNQSLLTSIATGSQTPDRFWKWFAVAVVAMIAVPVALAILGILAAIIIPNVIKARSAAQARVEAVQAEIAVREARRAAEYDLSRISSQSAAASAEELLNRVEQALQTADPAAIGALFNWEGVSSRMKAFQLKPLEALASQPTSGTRVQARFAPLPAGFELPAVRNGLVYTSNVAVLGMIDASLNYVENGTNKSWAIQIPYGKAGNHFYLSGTVERKLDGAEAAASGFELRWIAREDETNSPADSLPDANDLSGQSRLRVLKELLLGAAAVESAGFSKFEPDRSEITVLLTDAGGRRFADLTRTNIGRRLAIVWNGRVLSAPVIRSAITTRQVMITGNFGYTESQLLVDVLNHRNR
jgi:type II secretory pathway pseudopilin PulG